MQRLIFERDPDVMPTGKLSIFGQPRVSAEKMRAYAARRNPQAPDVAGMYLEMGARCGIRGDVAFCQAMLDTHTWTAEPQGPPWSPFAYAIWGGLSYSGRAQDELERRTQRHLEWLGSVIDSHRTDEPCWEDLGGVWAVANETYGRDVVALWRNMVSWKGEQSEYIGRDNGRSMITGDKTRQTAFEEAGQDQAAASNAQDAHGNADERQDQATWHGKNAGDHLEWLAHHAWVPTPPPYPGRKVSWAELARVVSSLEQRRPDRNVEGPTAKSAHNKLE